MRRQNQKSVMLKAMFLYRKYPRKVPILQPFPSRRTKKEDRHIRVIRTLGLQAGHSFSADFILKSARAVLRVGRAGRVHEFCRPSQAVTVLLQRCILSGTVVGEAMLHKATGVRGDGPVVVPSAVDEEQALEVGEARERVI